MPTNHTAANDADLKHDLRRILLVRHALQQAELCGPDDDPKNNGREAALVVIESLARQGITVYLPRDPEPERPGSLARDEGRCKGQDRSRGTKGLGPRRTDGAARACARALDEDCQEADRHDPGAREGA